VPQDDLLHTSLTVRKALEFGAELRFPPDVTAVERQSRVAEVLAELGLTQHADKRVSQTVRRPAQAQPVSRSNY